MENLKHAFEWSTAACIAPRLTPLSTTAFLFVVPEKWQCRCQTRSSFVLPTKDHLGVFHQCNPCIKSTADWNGIPVFGSFSQQTADGLFISQIRVVRWYQNLRWPWMTLNGVMARILRYFTDFGSFRGAMRKSGWRYTYSATFGYLISWRVSCSSAS